MIFKQFLQVAFLISLLATFACQNTDVDSTDAEQVEEPTPSDTPSATTSAGNSQNQEVVSVVGPRDCSIVKESGRYDYVSFWDSTAFITIDDNILTEHYLDGSYFMEAGISWTSDCTYDAQVKSINIPFANLNPGDVMKVEILETRGDTVFFKSSYGEDTNFVRMLKR